MFAKIFFLVTKLHQIKLICCAGLAFVSALAIAATDDYFVDFTANPVFENLIHPSLPSYSFRLIGRATDDGRSVVETINVTRVDKPEPWQVLNVAEMSPISKAASTSYFTTDDINFDGYADIALLTNLAMVNSTSYYWVFNANTEKYEALGEFQTFRRIPAKKELWTYNRGGHGGLLWSAARYKYINGKLVAVEIQQQDFNDKNNLYIRKTSKLKNGNMVIVKREYFKEAAATPGATWER